MSIKTYQKLYGLEYINSNSTLTYFSESISMFSNLNISNTAFLNSNNNTVNNILSSNIISVNTTLTNNTNINVSNNSNIKGDLYINQNMIIDKYSVNNLTVLTNLSLNNLLYSDSLISNNLFISGNSIFEDNVDILNNINISNDVYCNECTALSTINVSNNSNFNNIIIMSDINLLYITSGGQLTSISSFNTNTLDVNNITFLKSFDSNNTINGNIIDIKGNIECDIYKSKKIIYTSTLLTNSIISELFEFPNNSSAKASNIPINGLYRTGDIIKICVDDIDIEVLLNGNAIENIYLNDEYNDPGAIINNNINNYNLVILGSVSTKKKGSYIRYYNAVNSNNFIISTNYRIINVL